LAVGQNIALYWAELLFVSGSHKFVLHLGSITNWAVSFLVYFLGMPTVPAPGGALWRVWGSRWNKWNGKPKYPEKTCTCAALSTTNPTSPDLGSNPCLCCGKPARANYHRITNAASRCVGFMGGKCDWSRFLSEYFILPCQFSFLSLILIIYPPVNWSAIIYHSVILSAIVYRSLNWSAIVWRSVNRSAIMYHSVNWSAIVYHSVSWSEIIYHSVNWSAIIHHSVNWSAIIYHSLNWYAIIYHSVKVLHTDNLVK
jgi:hypothetical protein